MPTSPRDQEDLPGYDFEAEKQRTVTPVSEDTLPSVKVLTEQFQFLDQLRESGVCNMFGASRYLEDAFNLRRRSGAPILSAWKETFSDEPAADRAQQARAALALLLSGESGGNHE